MDIIFNNGQKDCFIKVPFSVGEITFEKFIDFTAAEQKFFNAGADINQEKINDKILSNYLDYLINAISIICEGDILELKYDEKDNADFLIKNNYFLSINDDISVIKVYCHVINLISGYKPKEITGSFKLEWQNETYILNSLETARNLLNVPLTVGEVVTTLELQRKSINQINKKGDLDGNLAFNLGLQELAILLRKENEKLPSNRRQRIIFIDERVEIFRNIPMDIILDIRFFLTNSMISYIKTQSTNIFSTLQKNTERQNRNGEF